jgi:isocitrate/isopropylmalate dehydrogenase
VRETYTCNGHLTPDVGGTANTREMTDEVLRRIDAQMKERR